MNEKEKTSVLFICTGNSCRSQMAEGFLRHWAGDRVSVMSAGSHPAAEVNRNTIEVMREVGIDISEQYPKSIGDVEDEKFDWVITVCDFARDFCPVFHGRDGESRLVHWSIEDPYMTRDDPMVELSAYRAARDDIGNRMVKWLGDEMGIVVVYDPA